MMLICNNCGSNVLDNMEHCPTCHTFVGFPNVRAAERKEEIDALESRYQQAIKAAEADGFHQCLKSFEDSMKKTCAVINVDLDYLQHFITTDKALYSNYSLQVRGEVRKPAMDQDDKARRTVESMLFGSYAEEIRYAALSLDGAGLRSYGPYAMKLREIAISKRASLLEDNSYHFIEKHNIRCGKPIPVGYMSTWQERYKLAVSKLADRISSVTSEEEYARILLLFSGGDRKTDDYIEIHIYGSFDNRAVESVRGKSSAGKKHEHALLATVKEYLVKAGKEWIEE
ncbi:TPA: hypothetical protein DCX15_03870 [bacterium]|nr:hypothetical protein [bacterium]